MEVAVKIIFWILFLVALSSAQGQDFIKFKNAEVAEKCYVIQETDSTLVFQRLDTGEVNTAKISDLDYYILRDGTVKNITHREITTDTLKLKSNLAPKSNNPDQRTSLTIFMGGNNISGNTNFDYSQLYVDQGGYLHARRASASQDRNNKDFSFGGSLLIPANNDISIILNLSYFSNKNSVAENADFYGARDRLSGMSFMAGLKLYLSH
jgi:hypothetical protein